MGGTPVVAVNLLGWPRDVLPAELAAEVLRGGLEVAQEAGCHVGGGHSIDDPEPKYGMAVTGSGRPRPDHPQRRRRRRDGAVADQAAGGRRPQQPDEGDRRGVGGGGRVDDRAQPRGRAGRRRRRASGPAPTSPASACSATSTRWRGPAGSPRWSTPPPSPIWPAPGEALADGFVSGGTRRNLDWVRPHTDLSAVSEDEALLLADAQTSGGLLLGGEIPGAAGDRGVRPARGARRRGPVKILRGRCPPGAGVRVGEVGRTDRRVPRSTRRSRCST